MSCRLPAIQRKVIHKKKNVWGSTAFFFLIWGEVPLKIYTRPEGSGMNIWGEPQIIFLFDAGFPLISIPDPKVSDFKLLFSFRNYQETAF